MAETPQSRAKPARLPNRCAEAEGMDALVVQMTRIADSLDELRPAADVVHDLAGRLDRLCQFIRRRGPWLLASIPLVLSAVGAITPELAAGLKTAISVLAGAAG